MDGRVTTLPRVMVRRLLCSTTMKLSRLFAALSAMTCVVASMPACSVLRHPTPAGNCPRSPERVAHVERLLVVGHRGAAATEIENTIPSMERALADGANAVEIDLSMTKDGVVVLWHDWDPDDAIALSRQSGAEANQHATPRVPRKGNDLRRPVDELTLAELRSSYGYDVGGRPAAAEIPTLDQFLDWALPHAERGELAYVVFDMKLPKDKAGLTEPFFTKVRDTLAARAPKLAHVFLTPHDEVYGRASVVLGDDDALTFDVDPGIVVVDTADCEDASSSRAVARGHGHASTVMPQGVTSEAWETMQKLLSCDLAARDRVSPPVAPKKVFAATFDDRDEIECLLDMGIDGILTNDPAALRSIAVERRRIPAVQE